ncbi:MAG: lysoplasmalogenase [Bacteroidetes bacterium]|nr:lysoplasmalogenase [Bacteroidota bacterium]
MSPKNKLFSFVYLNIFIAQLFAEYYNNQALLNISKPLIVVVLIAWLFMATKFSAPYHKNIFTGLIFAWAGDVLLMMQQKQSLFFIFGLIAFLICHLFYIKAFILDFRLHPGKKNPLLIWAIIFFAVCSTALFTFLQPHLGTMQIPVLIYTIIISIMAITSVSRFGRVNIFSFTMVCCGAVLFLFSDSMLACNRFVQPLHGAGFIIMASYMLAQYFIALGSIERKPV